MRGGEGGAIGKECETRRSITQGLSPQRGLDPSLAYVMSRRPDREPPLQLTIKRFPLANSAVMLSDETEAHPVKRGKKV